MRFKKILSHTLLSLLSSGLIAGNVWASTVTEDEAMNIAKGFVRFQGEQVLAKIYLANEISTATEAVLIN
jgi:hypothetical protein